MKEIPQVAMPGSRLSDPTPGELRGDPGGGDSERKAEPSAPNFTPTVADTVGSVGKSEQLGRNHGRKKSSRSTLTSLAMANASAVETIFWLLPARENKIITSQGFYKDHQTTFKTADFS